MNMSHAINPAGPVLAVAIAVALAAAGGPSANAAADNAAVVNRGVVELETGPAADVSVRMAAEIASIIDDGATRRAAGLVLRGSRLASVTRRGACRAKRPPSATR
jgi:hypothetical protein